MIPQFMRRVLIVGGLAGYLLTGVNPHAAVATATSAQLTIVQIECIVKQDSIANGSDEPRAKIDGKNVYTGSGFQNGTTKQVNETRTIGYSGEIQLWELDSSSWDPDDLLGAFVVYAADAGLGNQVRYVYGSGATYRITYKIV